jgi:hypothetical protein
MELTLFIIFLLLSIILISLGLFIREHTELTLIGFLFLFLLSFVVIGGDIQYKVGENTTYTHECQTCDAYNYSEVLVLSETTNIYQNISMGGTLAHSFGYWLAVLSLVGFVAIMLSFKSVWSKP